MSTIIATLYVHGSRDSAYDVGHKLGLTGEALKMFSYAAIEVKLTLSVDAETGHATITHVDDRVVATEKEQTL